VILTEEEAKTRRCQEGFPAAESINSGGYPIQVTVAADPTHYSSNIGVVTQGGAPLYCIGSACMAWRWMLAHPHDTDRTQGDDRSRGYCGKAGKP
jgi:hypothetical protein